MAGQKFTARMRKLAQINRAKYRYPPTIEDVNRTLERYNMSARRFEKFFGLGERSINNMKYRGIPVWTWHIWLEDIEVTIGYGAWEEKYIKSNERKKKAKVRKNAKISKTIKQKIKQDFHHSRINELLK